MKTNKSFFIIFCCTLFLLPSWKCSQSNIIINNIFLDIPEELLDHKEKLKNEILNYISKKENFIIKSSEPIGMELKLILSPDDKSKSILLTGILRSHKANDAYEEEYKTYTNIILPNNELTKENFLHGLKVILENLYNFKTNKSKTKEYYIDILNKKSNGEPVSQTDIFNAITVLQESNDKELIEPMIKLLKSCDDLSIGNALMMALGNSGNEKAMPAIIDFATGKPPVIRRQAIIAAKKIGSKLAAEWLLVMAYGYTDPVTKKEAKEALDIVETKLGINKNR